MYAKMARFCIAALLVVTGTLLGEGPAKSDSKATKSDNAGTAAVSGGGDRLRVGTPQDVIVVGGSVFPASQVTLPSAPSTHSDTKQEPLAQRQSLETHGQSQPVPQASSGH